VADSEGAVWSEVDKSRAELADFLDTLKADEWEKFSLCTAWKVRDVAGHLTMDVRPRTVLPGIIKKGFRFDKFNDDAAHENGKKPPSEHVSELRNLIGKRIRPPFTKTKDVLTDTLVHTQDIKRPLGRPNTFPAERWVIVADFVKDHRFYKTSKKRAGLKLKATDVDWSAGEGALVEGPIEAIVMALMGRTSALADLSGDGVETLRARL
jgi:uncharacterized protein (TIGR03083 family)